MRVASVNLGSGREPSGRAADAAALAAAVAGLEADVVAVQELDAGQPRSYETHQPTVLARALQAIDWRWSPTVAGTPGPAHTWRPFTPAELDGPGVDRPGRYYGIAVFTRLPVRRWQVLGLGTGTARLPLPTGQVRPRLLWARDEPRVAISAELDELTVIGTHLSFAPHTAARQLLRIRTWARRLPGPVLVAGDLNLLGPLPELVTGGTRLVRVPTFPAHDPRVQLDHLLSLGGLRGTDPHVQRLSLSDHCAVIVTVHPICRASK
jgi:endonuclease/exonuclease/phosphatase family metal-dependent hydrolase